MLKRMTNDISHPHSAVKLLPPHSSLASNAAIPVPGISMRCLSISALMQTTCTVGDSLTSVHGSPSEGSVFFWRCELE